MLNEPTSGLDPKASFEFSELLKTLAGKGVAVYLEAHWQNQFEYRNAAEATAVQRFGDVTAARRRLCNATKPLAQISSAKTDD